MKYNTNNKPIVCMQTQSTCYKNTKKMTVKGILWHSTGVNNPQLKRYIQPSDNMSDKEKMLSLLGVNTNHNDWNHIYHKAGVNAWIGELANGTIASVQTMPWNYRPWGCGSGSKGSCNDTHIQFEICEDNLNNKSYFNKIYKEACELTAYLCDMYNINPHGTISYNGIIVPTILCHQDSFKLGLGSNHSDIYHWFNKYGKTMDNVRNDVIALMKNNDNTITQSTNKIIKKPNVIYQVYADGKWWNKITNYNNINSKGYAGVFGKEISGIRVKLSNGKTVTTRSHLLGNTKTDWLSPITKWDNTSKGYSGWKGKPMDCIAIKAHGHTIKYRVHVKDGDWLNWISEYDLNDYNNGIAGMYGKKIDAVQITVK